MEEGTLLMLLMPTTAPAGTAYALLLHLQLASDNAFSVFLEQPLFIYSVFNSAVHVIEMCW